jgi:tetratricopeptide (TPR) repeat protein
MNKSVLLYFGCIIIASCCRPNNTSSLKQDGDTVKSKKERAIALTTIATDLCSSISVLRTSNDSMTLKLAICYLDSAISIEPDYYMAYTQKAMVLCKLSLRFDAINTLQIIVSKKPTYAEGLTMQGFIYEKLGDTLRAKSKYLQALQTYEKRDKKSSKLQYLDELNITMLTMFLYGQEKALKTVSKTKPSDSEEEQLVQFQKQLITNFSKDDFLKLY